MSHPFHGFQQQNGSTFSLYEVFVSELIPLIDDLNELKVTLYALWASRQREGTTRFLRTRDFAANARFMTGLGDSPDSALDEGLTKAVRRGTLLSETVSLDGQEERLYFVNDEAGRAAAAQVHVGQWMPVAGELGVEILPPRPTIYSLYEQNIGALTPMIRDELLAAQRDFPPTWIEEAMRAAVANNKRNWRYVRAILDRWHKEGKQNETPTRSDTEAERRVTGGISDFIVK